LLLVTGAWHCLPFLSTADAVYCLNVQGCVWISRTSFLVHNERNIIITFPVNIFFNISRGVRASLPPSSLNVTELLHYYRGEMLPGCNTGFVVIYLENLTVGIAARYNLFSCIGKYPTVKSATVQEEK
jgi:hypothetical protein